MNNKEYMKDILVEFCDCDSKKQAKLASIMRYMSEGAGSAYTSKGYSHAWLWERDFVFLLSRVSIHINRTPMAEEIITLRTWEKAVKGIFFYRDFAFCDKNNNIMIEASTAWVLANPKTRQITKPSLFTGKLDLVEKQANTLPVTRLKLPEEIHAISDRKIVYSDIDGNNHVHNAIYARIACDCLPIQQLEQNITDFRINFKKEATLGDSMAMFLNTIENKSYVVGKLDNTVSFECEFTLEHATNR